MIFRTLLLTATLIPFQLSLADIDRGKETYYMGEYERAIAEFTPDAEDGDAYALVKLGFMAENGWGTSKDYQKAHDFYQRAAELESTEGYISLAKLYAYAKGVGKNEHTAKEYLLKAASL
ncbi:sel1 repeat family protein, partial [Emcibacteraceae bacterium]|nr:sel1 repeat family protein [Emcibacteraceae bacterium]